MLNERRRKVIDALIEFVLRATQENATSEEIAVLPEVAKILISVLPHAG